MKTYPPCRIIADLRACTGPSSYRRGVGNLSLFWFSEMQRCRGDRELFALVEAENKDKISLPGLPANRRILFPTLPEWSSERDRRGGQADTLSAIAYSAFLAPWNADVVHVAHAFEDFAENAAGLPHYALHPRSQVIAATVYDFIPLVFPDFYFQNPDFKRFYLSRLQWLRQTDVLTAISESTRNDAVNLAGLAPERIIVIPPYIDSSKFKPAELDEDGRRIFLQRYGIRKNFVLYVGGDEYRKNIDGALRAFAMLPTGLREAHQLVLACEVTAPRREELHRKAATLGLGADDLRITGFVPDADLPLLYALCGLFVFPSLYEGLGLPLLEAMACGAPVIGGDNSSQREIIGRADAMFNARDDAAIAETMHRALTDDYFRKDLRAYGLRRSRELTRDGAGETLVAAFEGALDRKREAATRYVRAGCLPRRRLAYFSPIPPDRSGIADYSALLLPYLAEYFDIDIYTTCARPDCPALDTAFSIYAASDFPGAADAYDYILYEFGNSDFHAHMFELLERFPGVVTLHDAYLSGILHWMGRDIFVREALYSHGSMARRILLPSRKVENADYTTINEFSCNRRVLEQSIGIISHSTYHLSIFEQFYPEGILTQHRIIPHCRDIVQKVNVSEMADIKSKLHIATDAFIIASFGHITYTKHCDVTLRAFINNKHLIQNPKIYLIFVGSVNNDDYGVRFNAEIEKNNMNEKIIVTGYVNDSDFQDYLKITDVAVQLRDNSRGETSGATLYALSHGIPAIVNNYATFATDYPEDVVYKLSEHPESEELGNCLEKLYSDAELRSRMSDNGREFVRRNNDPRVCAALYAAAIHEFYDKSRCANVNSHIKELSYNTKIKEDTFNYIQYISSIKNNIPLFKKIYIDVSHLASYDYETGIQRVVRKIISELYCIDINGFEAVAVILNEGRLFEANLWLSNKKLILAEETGVNKYEISFNTGDILLMLDSSWEKYSEFYTVFELARKHGTRIITVIYDILPITLPSDNWVPGGPAWFEAWLRKAVTQSDGLMCISQSTSKSVKHWICSNMPEKENIDVQYWHLGSDFTQHDDKVINTTISSWLTGKKYLLLPGTVEPRKQHALLIEAMELLWKHENDLHLCIAGKGGWLVDGLIDRLRNAHGCEKNLVFIENPNDADLAWLYKNASGMILPSKGEGFGLPLVEAARYGTPILCSDIPVFHEIAGDHAFYLDISSACALAEGIRHWLWLSQEGRVPDSSRISVLTWEESAKQLLAALDLGVQG